MCRVVGVLSLKSNQVDIENVLSMRDTMFNGGPDAEGIWANEDNNVVLGHRRLSILDVSEAGNQPMHCKSNRYAIVYNGEVYNFKEVRSTLESLGHTFYSNCDTEVIIAAYSEFGVECANLFHGMFAFAVWDKKDSSLTLVRDRFGVKPLYFYRSDDYFVFASELKAIVKFEHFERKIDNDGLHSYFKFGYIPYPKTIFESCFKLEPGHFVSVNLDGCFHKEKWWKADFNLLSDFDWNDEASVVNETKKRLGESFERRLVSDVDVGLFLSGGIDSGLLASMLSRDYGQKLITFNVGFSDERYDESTSASFLAKKIGSEHHFTVLGADDCKELIPNIYKVWDEPFADTSTISTYLVCNFASQYVKVALSADGGDELFGGYPKHWLTIDRSKTLRSIFWLKAMFNFVPDSVLEAFGNLGVGNKLLKTKEIFGVSNKDTLFMNAFLYSQHIFTEFQLSKVLIDKPAILRMNASFYDDDLTSSLDDINKMLYLDFTNYHVDDIHFKVDRASMANSLEAREPFLDQDVVNFAFSMPSKWKIRPGDRGKGKFILRKIFSEYVGEDYLNLPKKGFGVPLDRWLLEDLSYLIEHYLGESFLRSQGMFDFFQIQSLIANFRKFPQRELNKIWTLISFQLWYEEWMT